MQRQRRSRLSQVSSSTAQGTAGTSLPSNGVCETGAGKGICTLRAAIQEANALAGDDIITFNIPNTDPGCTAGVCTI
jgi:CSLREA domain-containing protein